MIRYSDHNDALGGADASHSSDNLGAILAVSDWLCRSAASGRLVHHGPPRTIHTVLTAMIKAYEIQGCFQIQNAFHPYGMDHTIVVKLASTAVVSWLLAFSEEQTMAAISHVFMDGCPPRVYRGAPNTIPRKGLRALDLDPAGDFESIDVRRQAAAVRTISKAGELHKAADRDHCMQYIAVSLLKGEIMEVADYRTRANKRGESFMRGYLDLSKKSAASGITIVLKNGDVMDEVVVEYPVGHVENDNTLATVKAKFRRNMGLRFEEQEVEGILAVAENEDRAVFKFVDLLVRKGERENKL
ncbi:MAG: 2-methylcitrate dehydratase [Lasallia pustulata]|uniref:2-methylcitrate dehydratase n=1 Tax=Lasallia pustulata TaxID=136370 RepID=A0A5M8PDD3_9LECA|nr:MAG: 2-methylcitrate dehydratase [Lasallia pustulata]